MVKQYKNTFILIGAIILVTVAAVVLPRVFHAKKKVAQDTSIVPCMEGERFNTSTGEPCPASSETKEEKISNATIQATAANGISYEGKTLSITEQCTITPTNLSITKGDRIMIANNARTPVTLTRLVDTKDTLVLKPFRYATRIIMSTETFSCTTDAGEKGAALVTVK